MATHSSILAWRIPWREEPSRLQTCKQARDLTYQIHNAKCSKLMNITPYDTDPYTTQKHNNQDLDPKTPKKHHKLLKEPQTSQRPQTLET